jgi:aminoglycoside/choline kinase family phosphotransferase
MTREREKIIQEFLEKQGWQDAESSLLAGDASFRRYHRLTLGHQKAILMDAAPPHESIGPFQKIQSHLLQLGYSAPRSYASDQDQGLMLLEDFGDDTFSRLLQSGVAEYDLYQLAVDFLVDLHQKGSQAIPQDSPAFDQARFLREVMILTEWYYPAVQDHSLSSSNLLDYQTIWEALIPFSKKIPDSLILFDFHIDNLMRLNDRSGIAACGLLDFQDAVSGPMTYDLMSLLEDARRDVDSDMKKILLDSYCQKFPKLNRDDFDMSWSIMAAQRHSRVIGVFTRLCHRDGKSTYLKHIPRCWRLLEQALKHPILSDLAQWFEGHIPKDKRIIPSPKDSITHA